MFKKRDYFNLNTIFILSYSIILLLSFVKIYHYSFDSKISIVGDNIDYYILGNAIASGEGYTTIQAKEKMSHNHFPPGYPLIIATTIKLFSNSVILIKKLNVFFLLLTVVFVFLIIYDLTESYHISFISCLFTIFNFHLLSYSIIMMSEIPFLFFFTLAFWLLIKIDFSKPLLKNYLFWLLLINACFIYHIRTLGITFFITIVLFLGYNKNWKYLFSWFFGFVCLSFPWYLRSKKVSTNSYINQLVQKNPYRPELGEMELLDWIERFGSNFQRYISREIPSSIFNFIRIENYLDVISLNEGVIGICISIVAIFGLFKLRKYREVLIIYFITSFGILFLWPDSWFGVRFLIPFIPFILFFFINGVLAFFVWLNYKLFNIKRVSVTHIMFAMLSMLSIYSYGENALTKLNEKREGDYSNNYKNYFELAKWVKMHTPKNTVISCRKPSLFYFFSDRYVTHFKNTFDDNEQIEFLKRKEVNYVVLDQLGFGSTGRYLFPITQRNTEKFKIVKQLKNPNTYLMKFLPELGYTGEWKDNKRAGKGFYKWESGQTFKGIWKDGWRNGKGTLYFGNGEYLEASWVNDSLEGEAFLKSKEGKLIETRWYKKNERIKIP